MTSFPHKSMLYLLTHENSSKWLCKNKLLPTTNFIVFSQKPSGSGRDEKKSWLNQISIILQALPLRMISLRVYFKAEC